MSNPAPLRFWDYARKAGVGALSVLAGALSMGVLPSPWDKVGVAVVFVASYYGVYQTPNVFPDGTPVAKPVHTGSEY